MAKFSLKPKLGPGRDPHQVIHELYGSFQVHHQPDDDPSDKEARDAQCLSRLVGRKYKKVVCANFQPQSLAAR